MAAVSEQKTRDPVNSVVLDIRDKVGIARLGLMNNQIWHEDPRRLLFTLSRYKFVAKMLSGHRNVLEVGCGDGFCSRLVKQEVEHLTVTDFDSLFIADFQTRQVAEWPISAQVLDVLAGPVEGDYDAAYCLDVLEHIPAEREDVFLGNIIAGLAPQATLIVGMPSLESQSYASPPSRAGHINCKTASDLKAVMERHFHHVFLFSMNDEVVHTGYHKMAHYLFALCCDQRETGK
jgi:2-polyprenyl-3-methyl-5-hydroxy-6-metoxy-1,4-benzoquinol methylase